MYVRCNIVESVGDKLAVISEALFRAIAPDLISASSFKEARIDEEFSRNIGCIDVRSQMIYIKLLNIEFTHSRYFPRENIKISSGKEVLRELFHQSNWN